MHPTVNGCAHQAIKTNFRTLGLRKMENRGTTQLVYGISVWNLCSIQAYSKSGHWSFLRHENLSIHFLTKDFLTHAEGV